MFFCLTIINCRGIIDSRSVMPKKCPDSDSTSYHINIEEERASSTTSIRALRESDTPSTSETSQKSKRRHRKSSRKHHKSSRSKRRERKRSRKSRGTIMLGTMNTLLDNMVSSLDTFADRAILNYLSDEQMDANRSQLRRIVKNAIKLIILDFIEAL